MFSIGHQLCARCDLAAACPAVLLGTPAVGPAATLLTDGLLTFCRSPALLNPAVAAWLPVTPAAAAAASLEAIMSARPPVAASFSRQAARSAFPAGNRCLLGERHLT